ncbi:MAG: MCE family protein [Pseudobdellovibrionaceae bacterium]|nr:MCE family protein [Bdellovibrionales bacterium]USN47275.1 MAG: MCE family protein [Pseudobdellovibrionaceae bacterium]
MISQQNDLKVGAFVLAGVVLLSVSILLLGGDKILFGSHYTLYVRLKQAQGIASGSIVSLSGISVGNVRDVRLSEDQNAVDIELSLMSKYQERITANSIATVKTQGALGDKFIFIRPGEPGGTPLKDGAHLTADDQPDFIDLISKKGAELAGVVDVVDELHRLLLNMNSNDRSALFMENLVRSSDNLDKVLAEVHLILKDLRGKGETTSLAEGLQHLASILKKVDNGKGTLGAIINDPELHERLISLLGESPRKTYLKPLIRETIQANEKATK